MKAAYVQCQCVALKADFKRIETARLHSLSVSSQRLLLLMPAIIT